MANGVNSFYLRIVIVIGTPFIVSLLLFFNQLLGFYLNKLCLVRKTKRNNILTSEYGSSLLNWNQTVLAYNKPTSRWFNFGFGHFVQVWRFSANWISWTQSVLSPKLIKQPNLKLIKKGAHFLSVATFLQTVSSGELF